MMAAEYAASYTQRYFYASEVLSEQRGRQTSLGAWKPTQLTTVRKSSNNKEQR
jgi:hypothetical protein